MLRAARPSIPALSRTLRVWGLGALVSFLALLHALISHPKHDRRAVHPPRAGAFALAFLSVWLFATLVPFTDFVATSAAKVTASLGDTPLSPAEIQAYQNALGLTSVYHKLSYRGCIHTQSICADGLTVCV